MEDLGQLRAQYYVFKSSGLFARGNRLLQLYDQGVVFLTPALPKAKDKERESFPFSEQFDISSPDPNGKDVSVRTKRQNFSLVSDSRERLLTDLCYYKARTSSVDNDGVGHIRREVQCAGAAEGRAIRGLPPAGGLRYIHKDSGDHARHAIRLSYHVR